MFRLTNWTYVVQSLQCVLCHALRLCSCRLAAWSHSGAQTFGKSIPSFMTDVILSRIDSANSALLRCQNARDAKKVADVAKAAEIYAKRQKASKETIQYAHIVHFDAMALMGAFLLKFRKNSGVRMVGRTKGKVGGNKVEPPNIETLADLGISKRESSESQMIAHAVMQDCLKALCEEIRRGKKAITHLRRALKRKAHARKVEKLKTAPPKTETPKAFGLILADPPWRYEHCEADNREIENHYGTATLDEISKHSPSTTDDAVLFLWATAPKLDEALGVMRAWGFLYRSCAVWDKQKIGMGYWWRIQHELLLVGVKGNPTCTPESERVSSIFSEPRGKHSQKPAAVYEWIERAFPELDKLEMYCRSPRKGWHAWGNEV